MFSIGRVLRAHGLRGDLHVQLFRPRRFKFDGTAEGLIGLEQVEDQIEQHQIEGARWVSPSDVVLKLENVRDRNTAEALKGASVLIDPRRLPAALCDEADACFGARAIDHESGSQLGIVTNVEDNGAQALLVIDRDGKDFALPFVEAFIAQIEPGEVVRIRSIPGLFPEDETTENLVT